MAKTIGPYEIVGELGRGGMGVVYKAWEERLDRHVAIKMLADQYCDDETVVARFMREARAVASVHHPNIVQVFSVDNHEGRPYIVMEYVDGESLGDFIQREQKLPPRSAVSLLREAASGLAAVHARGVVHRDVKPANLMLGHGGGVKVVDFGIARIENPDAALTATGMAMGTPAYLSPEVCLAKSVDQRSDIFSLGVVLYEMLTGKTPFSASSPLELMSKVVEARIPNLIELAGEIDEPLYKVLTVMLASEPKDRYPDCRQLIADLDDYLAGRSPGYADTDAVLHAASAPDGDEATVALATPPEGVLKKPQANTVAAPDHSGGQRTGLFVALIGLFLLVAVGAAGWQLVQHFSLADLGFGQSLASESDSEADLSEHLTPAPDVSDALTEIDSASADSPAPLEPEPLEPAPEQSTGSQQIAGQVDEEVAIEVEPLDEADESGLALATDPPESSLAEFEEQAPEPSAGAAADEALAVVESAAAVPLEEPSAAPPAVAAITPPASPAVVQQPMWDRSHPRVAVIVVGDRLSAAPLHAGLEQKLDEAGYRLLDAELLDVSAGSSLAGLAGALRGGGADVMVFVELETVGQTELAYHGRYDTLYSVTVSLRVLQLHDNESLAPTWQDSIRYTALNAEQKAREMVPPLFDEVRRGLARL